MFVKINGWIVRLAEENQVSTQRAEDGCLFAPAAGKASGVHFSTGIADITII